MAHGTASVVIPHPRDVVWDYIVDPDHTANVLPGILEVRAEKRPPYVPGDLWHGVGRSFGVTYDWTGVFTRFDRPAVMEFRSTESRFPFVTTDTLDEVAGGTRYTCKVIGEPVFGGPLGRLIDATMSKVYQRILARHLAGVPAHVDAWVVTQS